MMLKADALKERYIISTGSSTRRTRWFLTGAGLLTLLAFLLRIYRLGTLELWSDEAYSYLLAASADWFDLPTLAHNTPPLHHWLLRGWMKIAGDDETGLRLLSAVFGALFVLALIWTGRELFSPSVGLWSGAFAAIAPLHIYYSQEARSYVVLTLMLALTYGALARAIRSDALRWWLLSALAAALSLYSHHIALLGLVPTVLLPWALSQGPVTGRQWRHYAFAMALGCGLFAPWALASYLWAQHPLEDPATPWLEQTWLALPPSLAVFKSLEMLGLGGQSGLALTVYKQFQQLQFPDPLRFLGLGSLLMLAVWGMAPWGDRKVLSSELGKRKVWLGTALLFPLLALWLFSYLIKPIYIVGRYDIVAFPAYALVIGLALAKLQHTFRYGVAWVTVAAGLLCIPIGMKLMLYYDAPAASYHKRRAHLVDAVAGKNDVVIFTDPSAHSLLYYLTRVGYVWDSGVCRHQRVAERKFFCHFFPFEAEQTLRGYAGATLSYEDIRHDAMLFASQLPSDAHTMWVVSGLTGLRQADKILFAHLEQLGFEPNLERQRIGLYHFRRPAKARGESH